MSDSVFTKIIKGEIPCHKVYEDDKTLAFMDIHPVMPGHVLVIPKEQVDHIDDLDEDSYIALQKTVKKVMTRLKKVFDAKRSVVLVMGYDVPHAHVHVMPSNSSSDFYGAIGNINEAANKEVNDKELADIAERIRF